MPGHLLRGVQRLVQDLVQLFQFAIALDPPHLGLLAGEQPEPAMAGCRATGSFGKVACVFTRR
jgi:hypothetical protein